MFAYIYIEERRNKIGRLGLQVSNFPFPTAVPMGGGAEQTSNHNSSRWSGWDRSPSRGRPIDRGGGGGTRACFVKSSNKEGPSFCSLRFQRSSLLKARVGLFFVDIYVVVLLASMYVSRPSLFSSAERPVL